VQQRLLANLGSNTDISHQKIENKISGPMKMINTVRFVVPLLMTTFGFPAYGSAEIYYPWCAVLDTGDAAYNCGFVSIEQCRATVSGIGGFCEPNPFYTPPSQKPSRHQYKRHD
jgi:hypothetical protein